MKLEKVLHELNSFEKNSFLKIIDSILAENPEYQKNVDQILAGGATDLKNADHIHIVQVFELVKDEFIVRVREEFRNTTSQLDILIDIIAKEGNAIMKLDWFARLYEKKVKVLKSKIHDFSKVVGGESTSDLDASRLRDYRVYKSCLHTAYFNDELNNQETKITQDEQSILLTLSEQLELSKEETKLINYQVIPIHTLTIDDVVNELKSIGVIFYSKKQNTIYVADEMVTVLRQVRGQEVAGKFMRRVLKCLKDSQLNLVCRKHGIDWKVSADDKIQAIIDEGISFRSLLMEDVHKPGTNLTDRKKFINELCDSKLKIGDSIKGSVLEDKINSLIDYFNQKERDDKVGISIDGYERLLRDLYETNPSFNQRVREEFEFQEEKVLASQFLLNYNIKPRDVLELLSHEDVQEFCKAREIKTRGDLLDNILETYTDSENLMLENYPLIGFRDLAGLKANGVNLKESDLGGKFEELTKVIFNELGLNVNEEVRQRLNTSKDKADIIVSLSENEVILIECKTVKENGYNKFSSVSRQLKAYASRAEKEGFKVVKSLLVAPDFSDDFIRECGLEYELNLSLISANCLQAILLGFRESKLKVFPHNLLMRDVLIQEDRVLKAIRK